MEDMIMKEFEDGRIWEHDIESANEMVTDYIRFLGGDKATAEDILGIIHNGELSLDKWNGERIIRLVSDYIDR